MPPDGLSGRRAMIVDQNGVATIDADGLVELDAS
jgi:hypothetical protein